jgi:rhamnulokinase
VDPADARFLAPADMEAEIRAAAGLASASRAEVVRCILESIASATARISDELVTVTGTPVDELLVVGGGARIRLMNELYGRHAGVPVTVGFPEATALGNAVVQGLALGQFDRLEDARRWLAIGAERLLL